MPVTLYRSTDASAPSLTGEAGSLITVLDAILVNGYGSKPAAGWTKPFSGTNKAAYRQGAGNQHYLRVQDDAPGAGGAREARTRGFESMTDVDTGTGDFPTTSQLSAGIILRKSATLDATARAWVALADNKTFYFFVLTGDTAGHYFGFSFGEFFSLVTGDSFRTIIIGRAVENSSVMTNETLALIPATIATVASTGHYVPRAHTGTGTSLQVSKHGDTARVTAGTGLKGGLTFPNGPDGGMYVSPVTIHESGPHARGRLRGFWHQVHPVASFNDGDVYSGAGSLAGKTFLFLKSGGISTADAVYALETSDTWETN